MRGLSDDAIDTIVAHLEIIPSPLSVVLIEQTHGAVSRVGQDETAFSHRDALYDFLMLSGWEAPSSAESNIRWTRELYTAIQPFLHGGIYVNSVTEDSPQGIRDAYRPKAYERLAALKSKYDRTNLFRLNPNIKPTV